MVLTLAEKILRNHLVEGKLETGQQIKVKLDQCLLQDATGTMAWLEYETLGVKKVKPSFCMQYIDHNMMQVDNKNMDDHLFLMTIASKFGAHLSLPGNGISHHVHKERFTKPGQIMIGSDSHTCTSGGSGMIAIGVGGLDVAVGMATGYFTLTMPQIIGVKLTGKLKPWCTAKDVILEILRRIDVDGGKGKILEFFGEGVKTLSVAERSTICNMCVETGATTGIFPSDEKTRKFFRAEKRIKDFIPLSADPGANYADIMPIELDKIKPLIALPHSPGKVKTVREVAGLEVGQAMIGSSTNSSYEEMMTCSIMISKLSKNFNTSFHVLPGSRQLLSMLERDGGLMNLIKSGARITEPSCNACIGMGNAPGTNMNSVRSFPRNWEGRSGTENDQVFLSSPETATACAIKGKITDPRDLNLTFPKVREPDSYLIDDSMIIPPKFKDFIRRGPNIKKIPPMLKPIPDRLNGGVVIKTKDDISTDHILPAGAQILPLRSNIPAISEFVFYHYDPEFVNRCKSMKGGFIVGGVNYGQGSSREHAAIAPKYLGIKAVLAVTYARIHRNNLINFGILPITFNNKKEISKVKQGDKLEIRNIHKILKKGEKEITVINKSNKKQLSCSLELKDRERKILSKGGLLNYVKKEIKK